MKQTGKQILGMNKKCEGVIMKKKVSIICIVLSLIMLVGTFSVYAASGENSGKIILDNDRFYAVIPDGYKYESGFSSNYYYVNDNYDSIEFFVLGNLMFPDGMASTDEETIKKRYTTFILEEQMSEINISSAEKVNVNGFSAWVISGERSDSAFVYKFKTYILTTKETLYIIVAENETSFSDVDLLMKDFIINGTYYEGDVPTLEHDFSKSEKYINAIEKDIDNLADDSAKMTNGVMTAFGVLGLLLLAYPIIIIVLAVKYRAKKKEIKEFESYCGTIYDVRRAVNLQHMQNSMNYNYNMNNNGAYDNSFAPTASPNAQNDVTYLNGVAMPKTGSYPATEKSENTFPVQNENKE